jgi:hypothetical protein
LVILLVAVSAYSIGAYIIYWWLLMATLLMVIGSYCICGWIFN